MNDHHYMAIDPGITSGYAFFDDNGKPTDLGDVKGVNEFLDFLDDITPSPLVIIVESYVIRRYQVRENAGSKQETLQVIGAIKRYGYRRHIPVIEQDNQKKVIGYKYLGMKPSPNHRLTHRTDALAHGQYYLQSRGIVKSRLAK